MSIEIDLDEMVTPKSDQQNYDDFSAEPRTVTITRVKSSDNLEQPLLIYFEGDGGRPYKPNKSMRRVLRAVWGRDGAKFVGRSMTLYGDPSVLWAGKEAGGIRISHMSGISSPTTLKVTKKKGDRGVLKIYPLPANEPGKREEPKQEIKSGQGGSPSLADEATARAQSDPSSLGAWWNSDPIKQRRAELYKSDPDAAAQLKRIVEEAISSAS
jgi:hypothetical protein